MVKSVKAEVREDFSRRIQGLLHEQGDTCMCLRAGWVNRASPGHEFLSSAAKGGLN